MRSFVLSIILFAVMLAGIIGNAVFVNRLCDDMLADLDTLPAHVESGNTVAVNAMRIRWERAHCWLSLSVSYVEMNHVRDALAALHAHCENGTAPDYALAREQLQLAIEEVRRFELLAWDNVI
ncbi:MAG: DUF4363 family protein [Clostridia bacterium]|nr:DUF4363 family protein [Clostridia bacterium]